MTPQVEQFKRELNLSSSAQKHLEERLINKDLANMFNIGFCPSCSSYSFDLLNGRLIVPIFDVYGKWIAFAGRRIDDYSTDVKNFYQSQTSKFEGLEKILKWKNSKWINTPYRKAEHLFNLNNAKRSIYETGFCIIVEGYFDVIHLTKLGFTNVVALCGTSLTVRQCELIFRYCDKIILILDGDSAGKAATVKAKSKANASYYSLFVNTIELPENTDPDQLDKITLETSINAIINSDEELEIIL